jgi:hypothetical protein
VHQVAEAEVVAREEGDVGAELLGGLESRQRRAGAVGAEVGVPGEAEDGAVLVEGLRLGLGDVVEQGAEAQRRAAGDLVREGLRQEGAISSATVSASTSSVWSWTSRWW